MTLPTPFRIERSDEVLERIRAKVAGYVWHEMPDDGGWAYGANLDYMKELCANWLDEFDWRAEEEKLNRFSHFTAPVDGIDIHFIHVDHLYNVTHWTEMPRGGHFAAMEQPDLLIDDIRAFARTVR